jgi:hypothetical protein
MKEENFPSRSPSNASNDSTSNLEFYFGNLENMLMIKPNSKRVPANTSSSSLLITAPEVQEEDLVV